MGVKCHDCVIVVDFGSQFVQLLARCVRELGARCLVVPFSDVSVPGEGSALKAIILSGSPFSCSQPPYPTIPEWVFERGVPVLGICYGQQIMVKTLGGQVVSMGRCELGRATLRLVKDDSLLLSGLNETEVVWMSHGDAVSALPDGFEVTAVAEASAYAAIEDRERNYYGVQFHPEVVHTPCGRRVIENFLSLIAGCALSQVQQEGVGGLIERVRKDVGDERVLCAVSGGVDSSVLFALLHKAIGPRLIGVFIDTGLLRSGEREEVVGLFRDHLGAKLEVVDASPIFLSRLEGLEDPEQKRKAIGRTFIEVFERTVRELPTKPAFLAQGTLYPDVVESSATPGVSSALIKSHHNVGGLPERMSMRLLEPFRGMFKDEVRRLGRQLMLPEVFIGRHPFPGPGLAVRVIGPVTPGRIDMARKADSIFTEELKKNGLYDSVWQAFAVILPVRTIGVVGDGRTYDYVCALRAISSTDGMTADFSHLDTRLLGHVARRIVNEVAGIGRVTYDITSKPPATIEWE